MKRAVLIILAVVIISVVVIIAAVATNKPQQLEPYITMDDISYVNLSYYLEISGFTSLEYMKPTSSNNIRLDEYTCKILKNSEFLGSLSVGFYDDRILSFMCDNKLAGIELPHDNAIIAVDGQLYVQESFGEMLVERLSGNV